MLLRAGGRLTGIWASWLAGGAGRIAIIGVKGAGMVGWRLGAGACGVVLAGWLGGQMLSVIDASAEPAWTAERQFSEDRLGGPAVTGALRNAALQVERPDWATLPRQNPSFQLGMQEFEGQPVRFTARRDLNSPLREDMMQAGGFENGGRAMLLVSFQRQLPEHASAFFVDLSRVVTDAGLSPVRTSQPTPLATKFGAVETADLMLSNGAENRACLAFRHVVETASLRIQGWLCGTDKRPADRQQLTCLLDRAALVSAGDDRELRAVFTRAELNRQPGCHVPKHQAAGRRATWLDPDQSAPKLRRAGG
jgi:hypothetical protein